MFSFEMLKEIHGIFWNNKIPIIVICLISTISIIVFRKYFEKGFWIFGIYSVVCLLLYACNPIFINLASAYYLGEKQTTVRVFLVIPIILTEAYFLAQLATRFKKLWRFIPIFAMMVVVYLYGVSADERHFFLKAENKYKVHNESIEIADMINEDQDGKRACVYIQDCQDFYYPTGSINYGMRHYTSRVLFVIDGKSNEYILTLPYDDRVKYIDTIRQITVSDEVDSSRRYAVLINNEEVVKAFIQEGFTPIGESGKYIVLRVE